MATINSVVAMGRSIKGLETFMSNDYLGGTNRVSETLLNSLADHLHRGAVVQFVGPFGNHLLADFHTIVQHRRQVATDRAALDIAQAGLVALYHEDKITLAAVLDRQGRDHSDLLQGIGLEPGIDELI